LLPESPRWLVTHGSTVTAMQVLSKSAKSNGIDFEDIRPKLQDTISKTSKVYEKEDSNASVLQLLRPGLLRNTIIVFYMWNICFVLNVLTLLYFSEAAIGKRSPDQSWSV
ncbi:hypothetical protein AVEN_102315-1, partial [Araneus ventricosus]